jgi:hypothetical protein
LVHEVCGSRLSTEAQDTSLDLRTLIMVCVGARS